MVSKSLVGCFAFVLIWNGFAQSLATAQDTVEPRIRDFEFEYRAKLTNPDKNERMRIWIPVAQSDQDQTVEIIKREFPVPVQQTRDSKYANQIFYFEFQPGQTEAEFAVTYRVKRREVLGFNEDSKPDQSTAGERGRKARELFLSSNAMVPTSGRPIELFDGFAKSKNWSRPKSSTELGKQCYRFVRHYLTYDKSKPGYGEGNVAWACDSKTGNCTDFHSLFISVARNRNIPSRFEIGFPLPKKTGNGQIKGYHCWAKFYDDKFGWVPVDISEADKHPELSEYYFGNLTENRVHFSTGRDIVLEPRQQSPPLNYFVYPHVEVDGKNILSKNIETQFSYRDILETEKHATK